MTEKCCQKLFEKSVDICLNFAKCMFLQVANYSGFEDFVSRPEFCQYIMEKDKSCW